jgi:tetratricopeptide (TPR) repeat protein
VPERLGQKKPWAQEAEEVVGMDHRIWRFGLGLFLVGSLALASPAPQSNEAIEEALKIFNQAKYLHQEGNYGEAVREYRRAAKLDDKNPFIYNYLGLALLSLEDYDGAIKALRHALTLNPNLTDVHNNLGVVYSQTGEKEKAYQEFTLVVRDPSFPTPEKPLYNLGELYLHDSNLELALMHFRRAVEKNPNFAMGYRGLGKVHVSLGEYEEAIEDFEKAIELLPTEVESLYELARIYDSQSNTEKAQEYYRRVVEADRFSALGQLSLRRLDELKSTS